MTEDNSRFHIRVMPSEVGTADDVVVQLSIWLDRWGSSGVIDGKLVERARNDIVALRRQLEATCPIITTFTPD